jgi:uncharacterized protein YjbJ (UPF0337 family)
MDENRIAGAVRNTEGKMEGAVGELTGNTRTKIEGKFDQGAGKVQGAVGKAIDELGGGAMADRASSFMKQATDAGETVASAVQDAAQKAGAQASDVGQRLYDEGRRAVQEQPVTAVLVAAAFGYVIASLVHRH